MEVEGLDRQDAILGAIKVQVRESFCSVLCTRDYIVLSILNTYEYKAKKELINLIKSKVIAIKSSQSSFFFSSLLGCWKLPQKDRCGDELVKRQ